MEEVQGFIVAAWEEGREARSAGHRRANAAARIFLTGRLDDRRLGRWWRGGHDGPPSL